MTEGTRKNKPKVVIMGAGLSGLAAATKLTESQKFDVTVVEGTDRAGGRVHSTWQLGEYPMELGANWLHGCQGNPLFKLAAEHNLLNKNIKQQSSIMGSWFGDYDESEYFYTEFGEHISHKLVERIYEIYSKLSDRYDEYASGALSLDDPMISLGEVLDKDMKIEIDKLELTQKERNQLFGIVEWIKIVECIDNACQSVNDMSLRWFGEYQVLPGNYYTEFGDGGFISVIDVLLKKLPDNCVQYNKPVKQILWNGIKSGGSEVKDKSISIETTDGETILADHVIVTCSLGYLKENVDQLFQPAVPEVKKLAIAKLGFGTVNKVFLQFEKQFWDEDVDAFAFVWDVSKPVQIAATNDKVGDTEDELRNTWAKNVCSLERITGHDDVLVGWVHGKEGVFVEKLDEEEIKETCVKLLKQFTGKDIPKVKKTIVTRWHSDQYARGSYSYIAVGAEGPDVDVLAKPLYMTTDDNVEIPQVLFAGEATSRPFLSTSHGAFASGVREGERLIAFYDQKK
ncbi:peroxisomal N(1)-acetyl-spermine/spermidine oxidase-like [Glandiceps talaboti]